MGVSNPSVMRWKFPTYHRHELMADTVVHAIGVVFAVTGGTAAVVMAALWHQAGVAAATAVYVGALLATMLISALYNLFPISETKEWLRRFDHATIFFLIVATPTPFASEDQALPLAILWLVAVVAATAKLVAPRWGEIYFLGLYVALGWAAGVIFYFSLTDIPPAANILIVVGGVLYTTGVVFHMWTSLRFHNAIWHAFVLAAAACHYAAVMTGVVLI